MADGGLVAMCQRFGVTEARCGEEATEAVRAEASAERSRPPLLSAPLPAVKIEVLQQVEAAQSDADCAEARELLRESLDGELLYERYHWYCDDDSLRRFLTARNNNVDKARKLLLGALDWRDRRLSAGFDFDDLERDARLGAMRVSGLDRFCRPVVVFDYAALVNGQQYRDCDFRECTPDTGKGGVDLTFLAYNLEHAVRRMEGTSTEKYVVFLHLSEFSMATMPPWGLITDALDMLARCYPERVGNIVFHGVGMVFTRLFSMLRSFIDPKTASKFVFIEGDDSPGSQNDATLREVIGVRWRELTGVGMPRGTLHSAPGYKHERDWSKMLSYELAWLRRDQRMGFGGSSSRRPLPDGKAVPKARVSGKLRSFESNKPTNSSYLGRLFSSLVLLVAAFKIKMILSWLLWLIWIIAWHSSRSMRHLFCRGCTRSKIEREQNYECIENREEEEEEYADVSDYPKTFETSASDESEVDPELQRLKELAREMLNRDRLTQDTRAASLDAALKLVDAIVRGLQSAGHLQSVAAHPPAAGKDGPSLVLTTSASMVGEIATRSRVPMEVCIPSQNLHFTLSLRPPPQACPFRCACHARCVGVAPGELQGWGELTLDVGDERVQLQAMTPVVVNEESDLSALGDVEVAVFDLAAALRAAAGGDDSGHGPVCLGARAFATIERVRGRVALTQYGGRLPSKQKIINAAHAAGAVAVIGYHVSDRGQPSLERALFTEPLPMVVVPREDGLKLAAALQRRCKVICRGIRNASLDNDRARRRRLADKRRCPHEEVWLHINGLVGRPLDGDSLLWEAVGQDPTRFAPEDLWGAWQRSKHNWLLGYKWARMIESLSAMARFFPQAQVHKGLGNILTDFMLVCDHDITWLRFQPFPDLPDNPAKTYGTSGIGVYGGLRPCVDTATGEQLDRARAHCYHGSLICHAPGGIPTGKRVSPSTTAFLQCFRGEAAGVPPADFAVLLKVFTACTGPVAVPSGRPWQRMDRTWHITDSRNALGRIVAKQGRLLWESEVEKNTRVRRGSVGDSSFWAAPRRDCFFGCGF